MKRADFCRISCIVLATAMAAAAAKRDIYNRIANLCWMAGEKEDGRGSRRELSCVCVCV